MIWFALCVSVCWLSCIVLGIPDRREGREPLEDVMVPPDLPIEAIAEEVKDAWRLKEVHVESLMKKAVEKSERPWLMFLGASTIVCIIMLALVFWRLESLL